MNNELTFDQLPSADQARAKAYTRWPVKALRSASFRRPGHTVYCPKLRRETQVVEILIRGEWSEIP